MLTIQETTAHDLPLVQGLWARGDVMRFVGFPDGLAQTDAQMRDWLRRIEDARPGTNHYSIFEDGVYCGETFYRIDPAHGLAAAMDIKLLPAARGRGIATQALAFAIREAFAHGAKSVWVDPNPQNEKALALYARLGFARRPMPEYLAGEESAGAVYMELARA